MHGNEVFIFLLSLAALLGVARLLGEIVRHFGLPQVVGELATGLILGQTGLHRVWPEAYDYLGKLGTMLAEGCDRVIESSGIPAHTVKETNRPQVLLLRRIDRPFAELSVAPHPQGIGEGVAGKHPLVVAQVGDIQILDHLLLPCFTK